MRLGRGGMARWGVGGVAAARLALAQPGLQRHLGHGARTSSRRSALRINKDTPTASAEPGNANARGCRGTPNYQIRPWRASPKKQREGPGASPEMRKQQRAKQKNRCAAPEMRRRRSGGAAATASGRYTCSSSPAACPKPTTTRCAVFPSGGGPLQPDALRRGPPPLAHTP